MGCWTISIMNNKGGVSKTTTTVSLAHALARDGKKVLVLDNDTQGNTSSRLLQKNIPNMRELYNQSKDLKSLISLCSLHENIHIIANGIETSEVEPMLIMKGEESINLLSKHLTRDFLDENYDFCLIDNPPNMGVFVINSLAFSDFVIVPIDAGSYDSMEGLERALNFIKEVQEHNPKLTFLKILLTKADKRLAICKATEETVRKMGSNMVFETTIPVNTDFQKSESLKTTILKSKISSPGAKAYRLLSQELIDLKDGVEK